MTTTRALLAGLLLALTSHAAAQELPTIRAATLEAGTLNWELQTIIDHGLDEANGFHLELLRLADNGATRVALEGGEAEVAVADWIWVARQRADGKDLVAFPYSTAVGAIVVPADSPAQTLGDLRGGSIGIAGGPLDKSWLILRAYGEREHGFDLAAETEQVFGAPPLIFKAGLDGETDASINYWHFSAKMTAGGMRELMTVAQAAEALGLDPETPLLTFVMQGEWAEAHPELVQGLYRASRRAKDLLMEDEPWTGIRPMMNAETDAEFEALRAGYRAGVPPDGPVDAEAAGRMLAVMAELGGEELVGAATTLPPGLFLDVSE